MTKAAFTNLLPNVATLICLLAMGVYFSFLGELFGWGLLAFSLAILFVFVGIPAFLLFVGGFALVQASSPIRIHGMRQLVRGRLFSRSAAASLIHGLLGAAALAGITGGFSFAIAGVHGYSPQDLGQSHFIFTFSFLPVALFGISSSLISTLMLAIAVELVEKNLKSKLLQFLIPVLLITITRLGGKQFSLAIMAITCASALLTSLALLFLYRSRGFAAAWLASAFSGILTPAVVYRHAEEPSFVWQANGLMVIFFTLIAIGIWGYIGNWVMGKFRTIKVG
jgi:hypothetical protein